MDELKLRLKEKLARKNVKEVMNELEDILKKDTENFNNITLLIGRYNSDKQKDINGTKTDDKELTKIRASVITIIDSLEIDDLNLENKVRVLEERLSVKTKNNSIKANTLFKEYKSKDKPIDLDTIIESRTNDKKFESFKSKKILAYLYLLNFILIVSLFIALVFNLKQYSKINENLNTEIKTGLNPLIKKHIEIEYTNQIIELGKIWDKNISIEARKDLNAFIAWKEQLVDKGSRENMHVLMLLAEGVEGDPRDYERNLFEQELTQTLFKNVGIRFNDNIPNFEDVEIVKTNFIQILNVLETICEIRLQNQGHKDRLDKLYMKPIQIRYKHLKPFKEKYEEKYGIDNAWQSIKELNEDGEWKITKNNLPGMSKPGQH